MRLQQSTTLKWFIIWWCVDTFDRWSWDRSWPLLGKTVPEWDINTAGHHGGKQSNNPQSNTNFVDIILQPSGLVLRVLILRDFWWHLPRFQPTPTAQLFHQWSNNSQRRSFAPFPLTVLKTSISSVDCLRFLSGSRSTSFWIKETKPWSITANNWQMHRSHWWNTDMLIWWQVVMKGKVTVLHSL